MLRRDSPTKLDTHQVGARAATRNVRAMRGRKSAHKGKKFAANDGGKNMANATHTSNPGPDDLLEEPVPALQQLLDNPFLLLFLGIAIPTVLYIVWGVMEIVSIPVGK